MAKIKVTPSEIKIVQLDNTAKSQPGNEMSSEKIDNKITPCKEKSFKISDYHRISFQIDAVLQSCIVDGDNTELWKLLCNYTHQLNINQPNHFGITPQHQSILKNNLDGVKILLNHGCEVNLADSHAFTPLHMASACGFLSIASLLVVFGADVFSQTDECDLPVDVAKSSALAIMLHDEMLIQLQHRITHDHRKYVFLQHYAWIIVCYIVTGVGTILKNLWIIIVAVINRNKNYAYDRKKM